MELRLLTWNLGGRWKDGKKFDQALRFGCSEITHQIAAHQPVVAAFQECVADRSDLRHRIPGTHVFSDGRRALVSTFPLRDCQEYDRFLAARIRAGGREIALFCYHGVDRMSSRDPTLRGGRASEYRWLMDRYCGTREALILGDFNADPRESEIQGRWCFAFANRGDCSRESHLRRRRGLRVVIPAGQGTHYWNPGDGMDPRWVYYDFFVASERLAGFARCRTEVALRGRPLLTGTGRPDCSDHLPVLGDLTL